MSKFDDIISDIDSKRRNPTKDELITLIKEALSEINGLHDQYVKFFEGSGDSASILTQIEEKLTTTQVAFDKLFPAGTTSTSAVDVLDEKMTAIKEYHAKLLSGDESIQADIEDSQKKITAFYNQIFSNENEDGIRKQIVDFHELLTKPGGIEEVVNQNYDEIVTKHKELFLAPKGKTTSRIEDLENNIVKIDEYKRDFEENVNPDIKKRQQEIEDISNDIKVKQNEVGALLSGATANSLTEAYSESKYEYSSRKRRADVVKWYGKIPKFLYNSIGRHGGTILNYALFILPLVAVLLIFSSPNAAKIIANNFEMNGMQASPIEILYSKTIVSLPLLWIAWFGQRNISQRKRLFEEYNHKLRVVQMYILFTTNQTYQLDKSRRQELDSILLETIGCNPSEHLGKGETYVDKVSSVLGKPKQNKEAANE